MENRLPISVVDIILEFQGYHIWRNGKYIRRLYLDDKYESLKHRPLIQKNKNNTFTVAFTKTNNGSLHKYVIYTAIYSNKIHWYMDYSLYYNTETKYHYIFGHNEKQHLPIKIKPCISTPNIH